MKVHFNPKDFLRQFRIVASVAPNRDTKPVLCNIKIVSDKRDGVVLVATDTKVGIRCRVDADVSANGEALLPLKPFRQILESAKDGRLTLESTQNGILVMGDRDEQWGLDTQSPDEFPDVAEFAETAYHEIPAKTLSEMIRWAIQPPTSMTMQGGWLPRPMFWARPEGLSTKDACSFAKPTEMDALPRSSTTTLEKPLLKSGLVLTARSLRPLQVSSTLSANWKKWSIHPVCKRLSMTNLTGVF